MVDVGVGEDERVDAGRIEREAGVPLEGLVAPSLVETAVDEQAGVAVAEEMAGTGDGSHTAQEFHLDAHDAPFAGAASRWRSSAAGRRGAYR